MNCAKHKAENPLERQEGTDEVVSAKRAVVPSHVVVIVKPVDYDFGINPEGEWATVNPRLVVFRPVDNGVKQCAHDADLKRMVEIRSPSPQLDSFKLHRYGQQRLLGLIT